MIWLKVSKNILYPWNITIRLYTVKDHGVTLVTDAQTVCAAGREICRRTSNVI